MGLPRTYKTLEANTTLGRKRGQNNVDKFFPSLEEYLRRVERNHILKVLTKCSWNLSLASDILNVSRPTLANKIKLYDVKKPYIKLSKRKMDYLIAGYIDGFLTKQEKAEIEDYLANDKDCRNTYNNAIQILKELEKEDPFGLPDEIKTKGKR